MKKRKEPYQSPFALLNLSIATISKNPVILFPYLIYTFVQLLILEIIFFAPRYPLARFFGPIIARKEGMAYFQYPANYLLMLKWFHSVELIFYVFLGTLFLGVSAFIVSLINSGKEIRPRQVLKRVLGGYIHLLFQAILIMAALKLFGLGFSPIIHRAEQIQSTTGIFFWIKQAVLSVAPFLNLLFSFCMTTILAFVIPAIVIDKKKIFSALWTNFALWRSWGVILGVVFISGIVYLPIYLVKTTPLALQIMRVPELMGVFTVIGIILSLLIDLVQVTAITIYYLAKKESI